MAKKTYKTYSLKGLQILLFDDYGRQTEVNFRAGAQIDSTAKFTTSDENVQKAIEACSGFNRDFYLESTREDAPVAAPAPEHKVAAAEPETTEAEPETNGNVIKVATKSDAIEWLKEHYPEKEYTGVKLRSKAAFDAACKECGVVFEITD